MICPDKIMECWESCNEVQLADAKNYYTKAQVDEKIDEIEVSGITEEKAEEMIDNALEGYYSRGETDDLIGGLEEVDAAISGAVESLDETVDGIGDRLRTLYSELGERAVTSTFAADVQSGYIDLQFTYKSGWGEDEDSETKYVELPSATTQKAGVMSAEDKTKLDNTYTKTEVDETLEDYTYDKQTIEDMIEEGGGFLPENYYDKDATDALLAKKANTATTYTKTNVNTLLAKKADTATTYTKDEINAFMETLEADDSVISGAVVNVSGDVATEVQRAISAETAISGAIPSVEGYFDGVEYNSNTKRINFKHDNTVKTYIDATDFIKDGMVSNVEIVGNNLVITFNSDAGHETITIPLTDIFNPNNYYTKTEVDSVLSGKADTSAVTEAISAATSGKADSSTVTSLNNVVTAHTANTNVHVTATEKTTWNNKSDFSGDYNDLTNKPTIPVVPTNVSDFTNDAGYITIDAISGKADTSAVTQAISAAVSGKADSNTVYTKTEVNTALSGKQNTLTAGSGITISNDTISAKIWSGTKAAYEALTTKDSDTIYLIYNE